MRRASVLLSSHCGRTEAAADLKKWSGRARLSAPHRGIRGFDPSARLGPRFLEPPDANGRTLSGTSAASTSQSGTRRTGRCPSRPRAQCMAALRREPLPLRLKEYPRERRPSSSHARALTSYRRNLIRGGSFFFTVDLAERRLRLLVDDIVSAKDDGFRCRSTHPTGFAKHLKAL